MRHGRPQRHDDLLLRPSATRCSTRSIRSTETFIRSEPNWTSTRPSSPTPLSASPSCGMSRTWTRSPGQPPVTVATGELPGAAAWPWPRRSPRFGVDASGASRRRRGRRSRGSLTGVEAAPARGALRQRRPRPRDVRPRGSPPAPARSVAALGESERAAPRTPCGPASSRSRAVGSGSPLFPDLAEELLQLEVLGRQLLPGRARALLVRARAAGRWRGRSTAPGGRR